MSEGDMERREREDREREFERYGDRVERQMSELGRQREKVRELQIQRDLQREIKRDISTNRMPVYRQRFTTQSQQPAGKDEKF